MNLDVIGKIKDIRTQSYVVYVLANIEDYLALVGDNFNELDIQRNRVTHKAYKQLKKDIEAGTLLPPITLALATDAVGSLGDEQAIGDMTNGSLSQVLGKPNQMYILDGLQRTYILNDLKNDGFSFDINQKVLLECWIEHNFKNLVYRFIVLNAGRKQVNLDHQIDLLATPLRNQLTDDKITFVTERDGEKKRENYNVFSLSSIVTSFYCFLTKKYYINKESWVANQMAEENALNEDIQSYYELFETYFKDYYVALDKLTFEGLQHDNSEHKNWFAKETTMNAFFAAIASYANGDAVKQYRVKKSLKSLIEQINTEENVLGLETFDSLLSKFNPRQKNIGAATRKLIHNVWIEFFRNEGETPLNGLWAKEVGNI